MGSSLYIATCDMLLSQSSSSRRRSRSEVVLVDLVVRVGPSSALWILDNNKQHRNNKQQQQQHCIIEPSQIFQKEDLIVAQLGFTRTKTMRYLLVSLVFFLSSVDRTVSWSAGNNGWKTTRRDWFRAAGVGLGTVLANPGLSNAVPILGEEYALPVATNPAAGQFYFPALTPPFANRATYRYSLGRDAWAFEQLLTFANVTATIRCNVIKLKETGGLWVHSPQWPTGEFCSLLDDLGAPVEHVILPCNAFEHKAPMQAFLQKYPKAKVWISPGQFGPLGSCGMSLSEKCNMGYHVDGILGPGNPLPPWANEFDIATLYIEIPKNAGPVSEVSFCHRPTKTLVATDAVVYVPSGRAPGIYSTYFDDETVQDPSFWPRTVLQAVFLPLRTDSDDNYPGYDALKNRLVRAPILRALVDARAPDAVRNWIQEQTTNWEFDRIITSHFASPIQATPANVRSAFDYLFAEDVDKLDASLPPVACNDWELLDSINQFVAKTNAGAPAVFDFQRGCRRL